MITLREVIETDREQLFEWRNLPDVRKWMYTDHEISRIEHDQWFSAVLIDPLRHYWVIELDGCDVGTFNLKRNHVHAKECDLGVYLGDERAKGKATALGALCIGLDWAFKNWPVTLVTAEAFVANSVAIRLYERAGMELLGKKYLNDDQRGEILALGIVREQWEQNRDVLEQHLQDRNLK